MSVALAPCPEIALPAEPAEGASRRERQIAVLGEIAEIGLSIAREIEAQLTAREMPPEKAAIAYGRVARAVRLTIALQSRLVAEARDPAPGALDEQRQARRAQVNRIVRRVVGEGTRDVDICVYRWGQARERLEHDDIYGDLLSRPASEIVAAVCQDLGVAPDWARLAKEAWAREEIATGAPGAPLCVTEWPPWQPAFDDDDDEEADEDDFAAADFADDDEVYDDEADAAGGDPHAASP
jgi:hypothetical protein